MQKLPDIQSLKLQKELSEKFSAVYPNYPKIISSSERRTVDWRLCEKGSLPEPTLLSVYSEVTGIPIKEEEELINLMPFPDISYDYLENNCCIPLKWTEKQLELLIADPYSVNTAIYFFKRFYNLDISFSLSRRSVIERLLHEIYDENSTQNASEKSSELYGGFDDEETLRSLATEAKIVRLVNEIFSRAVEREASDIHVEPEENKYAVRFRVDGILEEYLSGPLTQYPAVASRIKLLGGLNISESRLPQDGRTNIKLGSNNIDIRISTVPIMNGESIVLRLLRKDSMDFSLKSVGMNNDLQKIFKKTINMPYGIILVVGPTGSGKTTTLYSIMTQLNKPGVKIITIEDPVEYRIQGLSQMQVNPKIGLNFANGLRSIVRQDPDIILVGEIRDKETAEIAVNAALTGHLVLSTLHTNDAAGAISRLQDMGIEGFLISSALIGVLSQRLVRILCTKCHGTGMINKQKCKNCGGSGYKGRIGIFEFLAIDENIREEILNNSDASKINAVAVKNGMTPLLEDGKAKVASGITTHAEILRAASEI